MCTHTVCALKALTLAGMRSIPASFALSATTLAVVVAQTQPPQVPTYGGVRFVAVVTLKYPTAGADVSAADRPHDFEAAHRGAGKKTRAATQLAA